ncbi:uncharacterized protein LOC127280930 [Leptopilina boulardi]|uniref:uncharacterized protein LOC127280930 n=1 Tax=Leptopilina boulardi TaxID=63433 RepID=UPI0021F5D991|nr:uncharacterized protein LOC127280930 [Leptopilina boulardi]
MTMRKFLMNICYKRAFNVHMIHTVPPKNLVISKNENQELMALWPNVIKDLTESGRYSDIFDVPKWSKKVLQYNVPKGKMTRATDLIYAYKSLAHPDQLTDENILLARILAWCSEIMQGFLVIADDIMDHSVTRRGQKCWYLESDKGLAAIKDGFLIEQMLFQYLQMHFKQKSYYLDLVESFHENIYMTSLGQSLDLLSTNHGKKPNLNLFTMDRFNAIAKYKTGYYTFVMPITLAMHLAGIKDNDVFRQARTLLFEMGNLCQVNDDYLDCFEDSEKTGKIGTDIQEGKCTWFAVVAMQRVTLEQRMILEECYGVNDPEKVEKVKQLYRDLGLLTTYANYEEENYNLIKTHIEEIPREIPHDLFFKILKRIKIIFSRPFNICMVHTASQKKLSTSEDENREMMNLWPNVVKDLTETGGSSDIFDVPKWSKKVLQYNVPKGKMTRASYLIYAFKQIAHSDQLTDENIRLALILGWCTEIMQAFLLIEDDIMDHSKTRRGQPCWYLQKDIGLLAVKDGLLVEQMIFQLLRKHFSEKFYYLDLVEIFHDNIYKAVIGETMDLLSTNHGKKPNLKLFTIDRYYDIVKYKCCHYTLAMPVILAMHLAGIKDRELFRQAKELLIEMGYIYQIQDDYLDCYGDPKFIGKIGTDIQEGKCTWLVVVALQRVTSAQRKVLEECYGVNDPEKVEKVKQLYHELGLPAIYAIHEEENYNLIKSHIKQISRGLPHDLFFKILNKIHLRNM